MKSLQGYHHSVGAEDRALLRSNPSARRLESTLACRPGGRQSLPVSAPESAFDSTRKTSGSGAEPQFQTQLNVTNGNIVWAREGGDHYRPFLRTFSPLFNLGDGDPGLKPRALFFRPFRPGFFIVGLQEACGRCHERRLAGDGGIGLPWGNGRQAKRR